jgi:hypothetical protein
MLRHRFTHPPGPCRAEERSRSEKPTPLVPTLGEGLCGVFDRARLPRKKTMIGLSSAILHSVGCPALILRISKNEVPEDSFARRLPGRRSLRPEALPVWPGKIMDVRAGKAARDPKNGPDPLTRGRQRILAPCYRGGGLWMSEHRSDSRRHPTGIPLLGVWYRGDQWGSSILLFSVGERCEGSRLLPSDQPASARCSRSRCRAMLISRSRSSGV